MIDPGIWFERRFTFNLTVEQAPLLLERLRGTPARLEARLAALSDAVRTRRWDGAWSIQEHAGHLVDLEPLWSGRIEDFFAGVERLRPADLQNRATHEGRHNERPLPALLADFQAQRAALVARLEPLEAPDLLRTARHPRLDQPLRLLDHLYFVAEHDDHHLARITVLLHRHNAATR